MRGHESHGIPGEMSHFDRLVRMPGALIRFLQQHDYEGFVRDELARREEAQYPPYVRMVVFRLDGPDAGSVRQAASVVAICARSAADSAAWTTRGATMRDRAVRRSDVFISFD